MAQAGNAVLRVIARRGSEPVALAQVVERRLMSFARVAMLIRGPVWLAPALRDELEAELLGALRSRLGRAVLLWSPERPEIGDRLWGLRRVMTGYSTIWVDLSRPREAVRAGLHGKWRNMLRRAEEGSLRIHRARQGPLLDWLLAASERHRQRVGYRGPTPDFVRRLGEPGPGGSAQATLLALEGSEPVAGIVLQRHGRSATYLLAGTTPRGRALRAHHLLLWRGIELLQDEGVTALDLGGVDTVRAPGLARFKLGLGGEVATLAGTFLGRPLACARRDEG